MARIDCDGLFKSQTRRLLSAKAFTPLAKTKMITRSGRAVTRAFIGGVVYRDSFMVGECVRFLFTSCERSLNERVRAANE